MICTHEDNFVLDKFEQETRWVADLSNGVRVYQDDNRSGPEDKAWLRLAKHCEDNNLYIDRLHLQFRSHVETIEKADAYSFTKGLGVYVGNPTWYFYIIGRVKGDKIYKIWYRVPELIVDEIREEELQDMVNSELGKCIINGINRT